jgi:hypothetical protein
MNNKLKRLFCCPLFIVCCSIFIGFLATGCSDDDISPAEEAVGESEYLFAAMPTAIRADMEGGSYLVEVSSQDIDGVEAAFEISDNPDWVEVTAAGNVLRTVFTENEGDAVRDGYIRLTRTDADDTLSIPVSQRYATFPQAATNVPVTGEMVSILTRNYRLFSLTGYSQPLDFCTSKYMSSNDAPFVHTEDFLPEKATSTVRFTYVDVAINGYCDEGRAARPETDINAGYVLFNKRSARDGNASPSVTIAAQASLSVAQFSISCDNLQGRGIALYQSFDGGETYSPVAVFKPQAVNRGEWFSVLIDATNVMLKLAPVGGSGYYRMHGVKLYAQPFVHDGSMFIDEHFRDWTEEGFYSAGDRGNDRSCDRLIAAAAQMYKQSLTTNPNGKKRYPKWTVVWTMEDFALNPVCGASAGVSTTDSETSIGFIALQSPIWYVCGGHTSNACFQTSELPSVSKVRFSMSYAMSSAIDEVHGLRLWKRVRGGEWTLVGDYGIDGSVEDKTAGRVFEAVVNERQVELRFVGRWPLHNGEEITPVDNNYMPWFTGLEELIPDNQTGINRCSRIHDFQVWSMDIGN